MKSFRFLMFIALGVVLASVPSMAREGLLESMSLRGEGVKRVLWKKVLKARLYAPAQVDSSVILDSHPKCLQVEYYVAISRHKLEGYIRNKMLDNAGQMPLHYLQPGLQSMAAFLPDIHSGDSLTMCYAPSSGTNFIHNNHSKGVVLGDEFASVIFATWLGQYPVDFHLKRDLLGKGPNL